MRCALIRTKSACCQRTCMKHGDGHRLVGVAGRRRLRDTVTLKTGFINHPMSKYQRGKGDLGAETPLIEPRTRATSTAEKNRNLAREKLAILSAGAAKPTWLVSVVKRLAKCSAASLEVGASFHGTPRPLPGQVPG